MLFSTYFFFEFSLNFRHAVNTDCFPKPQSLHYLKSEVFFWNNRYVELSCILILQWQKEMKALKVYWLITTWTCLFLDLLIRTDWFLNNQRDLFQMLNSYFQQVIFQIISKSVTTKEAKKCFQHRKTKNYPFCMSIWVKRRSQLRFITVGKNFS